MLRYVGSRIAYNKMVTEFGEATIDPSTGIVTGIPKEHESSFKHVQGFEYQEDKEPEKPAEKAPVKATAKPATKATAKPATKAPATAKAPVKEDK